VFSERILDVRYCSDLFIRLKAGQSLLSLHNFTAHYQGDAAYRSCAASLFRLLSYRFPLVIHAAQEQHCTTEDENG
jgi:hypothetical protein